MLAAKSAGYKVQITEVVSSKKPGTIMAMSPAGRSRLIPGQTISVTIARKAPPTPEPEAPSAPANCTPGYDPCLPPASDYDCIGGTGDGPNYTGPVRVTGSDPYDLDGDNDGWGCE